MEKSVLMWVVFFISVIVMLIIDLGVGHRKAHKVTIKEATIWSILWISLGLAFSIFILIEMGRQPAIEYLTGYFIEKSLSVDNIFVFIMIFSYFKVPIAYQHRVLFWGIIGALVMRGLMIGIGTALIYKFSWIIYIFGAFLVFTGFKMLIAKEEGVHPESNPLIRLTRKLFPVTPDYVQEHFFVRIKNVLHATPMLLVMVMIGVSDLIFAVDSIPAIFAITKDPYIVLTSNVFAVLGLRALFFLIAGIINLFEYLKYGLSVVLMFVGVKMVIAEKIYKIQPEISLAVVCGILGISIVASVIKNKYTSNRSLTATDIFKETKK